MKGAALAAALLLAACAPVTAAGPPPLDGTRWVVVSAAGVAAPGRGVPTLAFDGGRAFGRAGCNRFTAGWSERAGALALAPVAATMMACADDDANAFEAAMLAMLRGPLTRGMDDKGRLVLTAADGRVLVARPAAPADAEAFGPRGRP